MKSSIKHIEHKKIEEILEKFDKRVVFEKTNVIPDERLLAEQLKKYVSYKNIGRKAVLGIDIYKYSSYGALEQTLVPFVFKTLFHSTIKLCLQNHAFIFQKYTTERLEDALISTGDGGFLILDNPLHALLFAINFAVTLRTYNAYHYYPSLRKILGGITVRYAITHDKIYSYDNDYYGRAIINNARILMKDDLNRCLIDEHVHRWFITNMDGIENLQVLTSSEISNIWDFKAGGYNYDLLNSHRDEIFEQEPSRRYGIINADILKIGIIRSKETELAIYNLHLQCSIRLYNDDDHSQQRIITISLGNLNTTGI